MKKKYDIIVVGEINPDIILSDPDLRIHFGQKETIVQNISMALGSSSVIFASGAVRLGLKVGFLGICGDDIFGHFMLEAMENRGIDISYVVIDPKARTGVSVILTKGMDRAILTMPGSIATLRSDNVHDDFLMMSKHLHIASYFLQTGLQPGVADLFARARGLGLTTSLDTNWDPSDQWQGFEVLLPLVDVFLPNEKEALAISRGANVTEALTKLANLSSIVVIKLGERGGIAKSKMELARSNSIKIKVSDTVGAGDSFDAGFLFGFLNQWSLDRSLNLACACGSLSTRSSGGTESQPDLQEALLTMKRI